MWSNDNVNVDNALTIRRPMASGRLIWEPTLYIFWSLSLQANTQCNQSWITNRNTPEWGNKVCGFPDSESESLSLWRSLSESVSV